MKIAFISTILSYRWGGADALWTSAAEKAADRGDRLLLAVSGLAADHARVAALACRGAELFTRSSPGGPSSLRQRAWRKLTARTAQPDRLLVRLRAFAPDQVIFSCGGTYDTLLEEPILDWLRSSATPYRLIANLQHEHPPVSEPDRRRAHTILTGAERIFFVSPRNREITRRHLLHPLPQAECIHGCAVHNALAPAAPLSWPEPEPWSLASIARLEPIKGLDLLIQGLAAGLGDIPNWRLNIYGRGEERNYLEECARFSGIGDKVRFPGFVAELDDIWRQNHLLVSPSVDEGVPMTIPEAMLRGRAVLATRIGGAEEWIEPGRTGFICPAPTAELLAEALRGAWSQRDRWREMGEAAAVRARKFYRPDDFQRIIA